MTLVEKVAFVVSENNAPAETTPPWQSGKSYVVDDRVQHSGRTYACARNNTGAVAPNLSPFDWEDMGATNPLRFCDEYINTQTKGEPGQTLRLKLGLARGNLLWLERRDDHLRGLTLRGTRVGPTQTRLSSEFRTRSRYNL